MRKARMLAALFVLVVLAACGGEDPSSREGGVGGDDCPEGEVVLDSGLVYEDIKCGQGPVAKRGMSVTVHYTGRLQDGTKFDSSRDRGEPFPSGGQPPLVVGSGAVIKGWDIGIVGMRVGGIRLLEIPPELGYGARGFGPIPPNATLLFEIELLKAQEV